MKTNSIILLFIIFTISAFTLTKFSNTPGKNPKVYKNPGFMAELEGASEVYINVTEEEFLKENKEVKKIIKKSYSKSYKEFTDKVAFLESSGRWKITKGQYIGKYQFGSLALKDLGIYDKVRPSWFRSNPNIFTESTQDRYFLKWMKIQWKYLKSVQNYEGKIIKGIKLTKSGMCAGAHLVGYKQMAKFIKSNGDYVPRDGNGTPVTKYLKELGEHEMPF